MTVSENITAMMSWHVEKAAMCVEEKNHYIVQYLRDP